MEKKRSSSVCMFLRLVLVTLLFFMLCVSSVSSAVVNGGYYPENIEDDGHQPSQDVTPIVIKDDTQSTGFTGDKFFFVGVIESSVSNVSSVCVEYWFENGVHINKSMQSISNAIYQCDFVVSHSLNSMYYVISANDLEDNWYNTGIEKVVIQDNDMPEIFNCMAEPSYLIGGGLVTISTKISDNIEVDEVLLYIIYPDESVEIIRDVDNLTRSEYCYNYIFVETGVYCYYFVVTDSSGNSNSSENKYFVLNSAPDKPTAPFGQCRGVCGISLDYSSSVVDVEGDQVYFLWDWGDGEFSEWLGPYVSDKLVFMSHVWDGEGNYEIRVKARDVYGCESPWSDSFLVIIPHVFGGLLEKISALCLWYFFNPDFSSLNVFLSLFL